MYCYYCMSKLDGDVEKCPYCGQGTGYKSPSYCLNAGTVLRQKYLVGRNIGRGGFGIVYIGFDMQFGEKIAIKEYYPRDHAERDGNEVKFIETDGKNEYFADMGHFLREADTVKGFSRNPNIVSVFDCFEENGTAYMVMKYLEGGNLRTYLKKNGKQDAAKFVKWFMPLLEALREVHGNGIIHRDINPPNIIIEEGSPVLIDFGAAREPDSDNTLSVILRRNYAPVEQYSSNGKHGKQGPWTDIYAVCATIYEAVTGEAPPESCDRMIKDELVPPSETEGVQIPDYIEKALLKGLSNLYNERQQSIDELIRDLTQPVTDVTMSADVHVVSERKVPDTVFESDEKKGFSDSASVKRENLKVVIVVLTCAIVIITNFVFNKMALQENNDQQETPTGTVAEIEGNTEKSTEKSTAKSTAATAEKTTADNSKEIAAIISDAEISAAESDYVRACEKIVAGLERFPDSVELQDKNNEYADIIAEQGKAEILAKAEECAANGDYLGALKTISGSEFSGDEELSQKSGEYENEYIKQVISEADALVSESKHDEAISRLRTVKQDIGNTAAVDGKIAEIEGKKPVPLEPYENPDCTKYTNGSGENFSMMGIEYSNGVQCHFGFKGYALYNLHEEYSKIEFEVGHVDGSYTFERELYVYVYVGEKEECVQTMTLLGDMVTQRISVPVENAKRIKIEFSGGGYAIANVKGYK